MIGSFLTKAILVSFLLLGMLLAGCAVSPVALESRPEPVDATTSGCAVWMGHLTTAVAEHGVGDAQDIRLADYPYLRLNRFLASFQGETGDQDRFTAWLDRLQAASETGLRLELANLPPEERTRLQQEADQLLADAKPLPERITQCSRILRSRDATQLRHLAPVTVPDEYADWQRLAGLYWLTMWPVSLGVSHWHEELLAAFRRSSAEQENHGPWVTYQPPADESPLTPEEVAAILQRSAQNPLAIPDPLPTEQERLFATFAPIWRIATKQDADRLGTPVLDPTTHLSKVDIIHPTVFRHLSHTRMGKQTLLQLNYIVWFPARPATKTMDIVAGHLDGLTWRVTLAQDGRPLLYDTIHNCGCYHLFFPAPGLQARPGDDPWQEAAFVPKTDTDLTLGRRILLRVAATTHFVEGVEASHTTDGDKTLAWADYDALRSLPLDANHRQSLFGSDGIVPGTERPERLLLWPMGVPHPGEMRQWGHHATAFFGRRHFDDPWLIPTYFQEEH